MNKKKEWIKAIILLPGNALIVIPAILLYFGHYKYVMPELCQILFGLLFLISGCILIVLTMGLFDKFGDGTAAPWAPPKNFVVKGPYRYVRNPMLLGVLSITGAGSLLLNTKILFWWLVVFWIINTLYFIFFEEKDLEKRFGEDYLKYKKSVPRWIPKLKPYIKDDMQHNTNTSDAD